ncbi:MAG: enoyl-CoA hydratase/isomerase family protein [Dehalococcoidia bacterium]
MVFVHSNTEFVLENSITQLISKIRQPVIMSVEKNAKDYGFESMISADLVVCTTGSIFSYRQLIEGIPPLGGVTQRLPRLIGVGRSLDMILTGREISYDEALDINLVQYISETTAIDESLKISQSINQMAPIALLYIKEAVKTGKEMTLTQGISLEADLSFLLQSTHDRKEGLDSFFDRRKPEFKGE